MAMMNGNPTVKPKDTKGTLKKLVSYLGRHKLMIALIALLCVVSNILVLLGPDLAGKAINAASSGTGRVDFAKVKYYVVRMLIFYTSSSLLTISINIIMMRVSKLIANQMRQDVFEKLMKLPVGFFDKNATGDIISRVSYDVDVISTCLATDITAIMTSVITVVGSLVMMLVISPLLSLSVIITVPVTVLYTTYIRKKAQPKFLKRSKSYGVMNGFVEEMFTGQKTILSYAYEDDVCGQFERWNREAADNYCDAEIMSATMGPSVSAINNMGLALIGLFGAIFFMTGRIELGSISSFILYSRKFSGPINEIANVISEIYSALSAAERVFNLLDENEEIGDVEDAAVLETVRGDVSFKNVVFGYDKSRTIIHDFSMDAKAGKLIAIVGPTGAGKTTLINLLMRFYDVDEGSIAVDERDIRKYTRESLRKAYAMVLQDTWVFKGTIFDNIAYGKEDATKEEVVAAAKAAHIHSFIMRLPKGYDTVIEEDGGNISKGQKQLLTIARAMLYDSKMLILDEATSNVDTSTEREIQKAMRELMKDKTCFVIAHRLSTIRNADLILVLDHGDIVEQGTHDSLIAKKGYYHKLYSAQFE